MAARVSDVLRRFWVVVLIGLLMAIFGGYILFEKVVLSLINGFSYERAGLVTRAEDGFSFWLGIGVYGVCAGIVLIGGLALMTWGVRKRPG